MPYRIRETEEYYPLSVLFHESGMEIEIEKTPPAGMVKMWRMEDGATGKLLGAATLQIWDNVYTLGDLAVRNTERNKGYGGILQQVVFDEARKMGVKEIRGSAKVPNYYYRLGWVKMDWNTSPKVAVNCHDCKRQGNTCFPEIIKREI